ncbi:MAG: 4-hydroxy-3-methylbut-2-enyl diphosphate reductase [Candidatus Omnitrophica bacterium]|nr:4-hydroxy-3-methylbut-2-enyl diphosphate reductase [Candidatus Omnitrophota bacterium]
MHINLAKSAGFCFGVKRALNIAFQAAATGEKVSMLGDIVHNEEVVKEVKKSGIRKIKSLKPTKNEFLLIRAHGADLNTFNKAIQFGYKIIDATCPMVREIHKIAENMEKKGFKIIVIGDKRHDEVYGIIGKLKKKALVIEELGDINLRIIGKIIKACVVVQSTQNQEKVLKIVSGLKKHIKQLEFFNTICLPTRTKQNEIRNMPLVNNVMIIIGSKKSANTKRLYEISYSLNKRSYWINSKQEIKPGWFKNTHSVGITAGASTPEKTISVIIEHIRKIVAK